MISFGGLLEECLPCYGILKQIFQCNGKHCTEQTLKKRNQLYVKQARNGFLYLVLSNVLCCWLFVSAGQLLPARRSRLFTQESSRLPSSWRPAEPAAATASLLCCRWNCASISLHSARGLRWCSPGVELEWLFPLLVPCQSSCQKLTAGETVPASPCTLHVVTFQ